MIADQILLFTDAVDSTRLTESLGDVAASALWAEHDRIVRREMRAFGGREIDKSDGFLLLFPDVQAAVACALALHRCLAGLVPPVTCRAGIHRGPMVSRENSLADQALGAKPIELDGIGKAMAARVMTLAQGGQTLLSAAAAEALRPEPGWHCTSLGHWRLKGLAEPVELFELVEAGAGSTPPPDSSKAYRVVRVGDRWTARAELRNSLPAERDGFVGRGASLSGLAACFDDETRLVTVLGIGGIGKTRLARRYARDWLGDHPGGAWFCDLSAARSLDGIVHAVAQGLDVPLGRTDPVQQLAAAIAGRGPCLVVLDNFEQVVRHAERTVGVWLDRAPEARFLVTSREVLGLSGERSFVLPPMTAGEALQLFQARVAAAQGGEVLDEAGRTALPQLVEMLDRLPLAIELAAARTRVMSVPAILRRMDERFKLLASTGGRGDRQATLRAALDWSWELLSPAEREVLAQLSVFEGGFTLESAEAVVELEGSGGWTADIVQGLVQKSLLFRQDAGRLGMLATVHDYAAERRAAAPALAGCLERHMRHFAAEPFAPARSADLDNIVAACRRAARLGHVALHARTLVAAWECLRSSGPFHAVFALASPSPVDTATPATEAAMQCWVLGSAHLLVGEAEQARQQLDEGLQRVGRGLEAAWHCRLLCASGEAHAQAGHTAKADHDLSAALALARGLGEPRLLAETLNAMGGLALRRGDLAAARSSYEQALEHAPSAQMRGGLLGNLGEVAQARGDLAEACLHYEEALALVGSARHRRWEGNTRCNLGLACLELGRGDDAKTHFDLALGIARDLGYSRLEATVLCNLGLLALARGDGAAALEPLQASVRMAASMHDAGLEACFGIYLARALRYVGRAREALDTLHRAEAALAEDPANLGLVHVERGQALLVLDDAAGARLELDAAERLSARIEAEPSSELGLAVSELRLALGGALSSCS